VSEPSDTLLADLIDRFVADGFEFITLMASLSEEVLKGFREKGQNLINRMNKAKETFRGLSDDKERLNWALANFEGLSEEMTALIREIRQASERK
jgi:hypothetical protein